VSQRVLQTLGAYEPKLLACTAKTRAGIRSPWLPALPGELGGSEVRCRASDPGLPRQEPPDLRNEAMEMRGWTGSQLGAFLSVKKYPT